MKKIFTFLIGLSLWTLTATAQEPVPETTSPVATETDSLQRVVDDLSQQLRHQKNEELDRKIWKNRSKYFNLGYVKQSLVFKDFGDEKLKTISACRSVGVKPILPAQKTVARNVEIRSGLELGRSELFEIHDLRTGRAGFGFRRRHYG